MLTRLLDRLDRLIGENLPDKQILDALRAASSLKSESSDTSTLDDSSDKFTSDEVEERALTESIPSDYKVSDSSEFTFQSSPSKSSKSLPLETVLDELDKISDFEALSDAEVLKLLRNAVQHENVADLKEDATAVIVKSKYPNLEVLDIDWPNRDENSQSGLPFDGFRRFMIELYAAFRSVGVKLGRPEQDMYCDNDPFNKGKYNPDALPIQQEIIPIYLHPSSPYHGLMLYHEVGTGKSRNAFRIIGQYKDIPDFRLIWVTSDKLRKTTPNQSSDFPTFHGTSSTANPFIKGATTSNHRSSKDIAIFSYVEFVNVMSGKNKRGYSNQLAMRAKKYNGDPFANTLIVLDEAHKIFERTGSFGNGAYKDQDIYERIARHSYSTEYTDPTVKHCRWLVLTATPAPTIEAPTNQKDNKVEIAGGTFATLRLLNLLIDNPNKLFPTDEKDIEVFNREYKGVDFANIAKGLISYFKPTNWRNVFASIEGANDGLTKKPLTQGQTKQIRNIMKRSCSKYGKAKDDKAKVALAQCYLRRLHWYGNMLGPKMPADNIRKKVLGASTSPTKYPGGLDPYANGRELNADHLPLGASLLSEIEVLDRLDLENTGKKFKHLIFSNDKNHAAAAYAAMLTMPKTEGGLDFAYVSVDDANKANAQGSDTLMFMHNDMEQKDSDKMQKLFNDHERNANGELARIMVLGSGRKEGISLFDVKYVHMMEPQISETNKTQIIGRAVRRCGHIGLDNQYRKVRVIVYGFDTDSTNVIELKAPGLTSLGEIANAVMKQGEAFGEKLVVRDKILKWMELTAIDSVDTPTTVEFEQKLNDIHQELNQTDLMTANMLNQVEFVGVGANAKKMTIKALRAKCKELGMKGVAKINKTNFDDYYDVCVNQKALPQTLDENGKVVSHEQLSMNSGPKNEPRKTGDLIPPDFNTTDCDIDELKQICRDYKVKPIPTPKSLKAKKEKGLVPPDWTFKRELIAECGKYVVPNEPFPARVAKRDLKPKAAAAPERAPQKKLPSLPPQMSPPRRKPLPPTPKSSSFAGDVSTIIKQAIVERYRKLPLEQVEQLTVKQVREDLEQMLNMNLEQHKNIIKDQLLRFIVRSKWSA